MKPLQFQDILQSIPMMSPEQIGVLHKTLPPPPITGDEQGVSGEPRLLERLKFYFDQHPACPHCCSEAIKRWGTHAGHQRYRCKQCLRTFNAMTKSPLAHLRVRDKLDQYLECMDGSTTLRPAAAKCGISLNTSLHLRHRLMAVVKYVKEEIYHIQTVNAFHSDLKSWINGFFKGVATKYLSRYLGWKRFLKTQLFSEEAFLDQVSIHWVEQHLI